MDAALSLSLIQRQQYQSPAPGVWTRDTVTTCTGIGFAQIRLVTCHVTNCDNQEAVAGQGFAP